MIMNKKTSLSSYAFIIFIIICLSAIVFALTSDELDYAYTCPSTQVTALFFKLSDTRQTGYYYDLKGDIQLYVCKDGLIETLKWAEENHIDTKELQLTKDIISSKEDEIGREIIPVSTNVAIPTIMVDKSKEVVIEGKIYNIEYTPIIKEVIKCICEKTTGCKIQECLQ